MKKQTFNILLLIFISFIVYLFLQNILDEGKSDRKTISQVCIQKNCFSVEVAETSQKWKIGLMNRDRMSNDSGMLFIFEKEGFYNFWMKNTLISLDIIWIDGNNKIIYTKKNAQPCKIEKCETFGPDQKAKYVLEINGGLVKEMGLKIENKVEFK